MRLRFVRNILIGFCIFCVSCGNSSATAKKNAGISKTEVEQMIKSSTDNFSQKIDSIQNSIRKEFLDEVQVIKKQQLEKEKGNKDKWLYLSWLTLLTGLIVWLVYCWNKALEKKDLRKIEHEIEKLKSELKQILNKQDQDITKKNLIIKEKEGVNLRIQQILERLLVIEKNQKNITEKSNKIISTVKVTNKTEEYVTKEGYFGIVKGHGIFNDVFNSKQDESKFKVWFKSNGNEAEFDLIDLKRIKSFDGIDKAVQFDISEASLLEALSYETLKRGTVVKKGDFWEINQKVKIKLKK